MILDMNHLTTLRGFLPYDACELDGVVYVGGKFYPTNAALFTPPDQGGFSDGWIPPTGVPVWVHITCNNKTVQPGQKARLEWMSSDNAVRVSMSGATGGAQFRATSPNGAVVVFPFKTTNYWIWVEDEDGNQAYSMFTLYVGDTAASEEYDDISTMPLFRITEDGNFDAPFNWNHSSAQETAATSPHYNSITSLATWNGKIYASWVRRYIEDDTHYEYAGLSRFDPVTTEWEDVDVVTLQTYAGSSPGIWAGDYIVRMFVHPEGLLLSWANARLDIYDGVTITHVMEQDVHFMSSPSGVTYGGQKFYYPHFDCFNLMEDGRIVCSGPSFIGANAGESPPGSGYIAANPYLRPIYIISHDPDGWNVIPVPQPPSEVEYYNNVYNHGQPVIVWKDRIWSIYLDADYAPWLCVWGKGEWQTVGKIGRYGMHRMLVWRNRLVMYQSPEMLVYSRVGVLEWLTTGSILSDPNYNGSVCVYDGRVMTTYEPDWNVPYDIRFTGNNYIGFRWSPERNEYLKGVTSGYDSSWISPGSYYSWAFFLQMPDEAPAYSFAFTFWNPSLESDILWTGDGVDHPPTVPYGDIDGTVTALVGGLAIEGVGMSTGPIHDTTDASGDYVLSTVPVGDVIVLAEKDGYLPATAEVEVTDGDTITQDFQLTALGEGECAIVGFVTDIITQRGLSLATVHVGDDLGYDETTDANGYYCSVVAAGTYDVSAELLGYSALNSGSITVVAGDVVRYDIRMTVTDAEGTGGVFGVVSDTSGDPLVDVVVDIDGYQALTDSDGMYLREAIPVGDHPVTATLSGYFAPSGMSVTVVSRQTSYFPIVMWADGTQTGSLSVSVYDESSLDQLDGATVDAFGFFSGVTNDWGNVDFTDVAEGEYTLIVQHDGFIPSSTSCHVVAGERSNVTVCLEPIDEPPPGDDDDPGMVYGIVKDATDDSPLEGATVDVGVTYSGTTDAGGDYKIDGIVAKRYDVDATLSGYIAPTGMSIIVRPHTATRLDIGMLPDSTPVGSLDFSVVSAYTGDPIPLAEIRIYEIGNTVTDSSGHAVVGNLQAGDVSFGVSASGFEDGSGTATVVVSATTDVIVSLFPEDDGGDVENRAPVPVITEPENSDSVTGTEVVEVSVTDDHGISLVRLYLDGTLIKTWNPGGNGVVSWSDTHSLDTSGIVDGYHVLTLTATDDEQASQATTVIFTTSNGNTPTGEAPSITVTSPQDGDTMSGVYPVSTATTDDAGIESVIVIVAGDVFIHPVLNAPTAYETSENYDFSALLDGSYDVVAIAIDTDDNVGVEKIVVDVNTGGVDNGRRGVLYGIVRDFSTHDVLQGVHVSLAGYTYPSNGRHYATSDPNGYWMIRRLMPGYETGTMVKTDYHDLGFSTWVIPKTAVSVNREMIPDDVDLDTLGAIEGTVFDAEDGSNLMDVKVMCDGFSEFYTDEYGLYTIQYLDPDDMHWLLASKRLYHDRMVENLEVSAGETTYVDIALHRYLGCGTLDVTVVGDDAVAIEGAGVLFMFDTVMTDSDGSASFPTAPSGIRDVVVFKDGYIPVQRVVQILDGETTSITVVLYEMDGDVTDGILFGHVFDQWTLGGIEGALIVADGTADVRCGSANLGYYMAYVPADTYDVTGSKEGYHSRTFPGVDVSSRECVLLDIPMLSGSGEDDTIWVGVPTGDMMPDGGPRSVLIETPTTTIQWEFGISVNGGTRWRRCQKVPRGIETPIEGSGTDVRILARRVTGSDQIDGVAASLRP